MRATLFFAGLLVMSVLPAAAQPASVVEGTWSVTWDAGLRTRGDEVLAVTRRITGTLVLTAHGDSLSGTWTPMAGEPPVAIGGTLRNGVVRLESAPREVDENGRTLTVRTRFEGRLVADRLEGTLHLHLNDRPSPPRRWQAVRRSS